MSKNDWIKMRDYEDMPLTEFLNAVSFHLYLKRKQSKVISDAVSQSKKSSEPVKLAILGQIMERL